MALVATADAQEKTIEELVEKGHLTKKEGEKAKEELDEWFENQTHDWQARRFW